MINIENCLNNLKKIPNISAIERNYDGFSYTLDFEDLHITLRRNRFYNDWDVHIDDCDMDTVAHIHHMKYIEQVLNIAKQIRKSYDTAK